MRLRVLFSQSPNVTACWSKPQPLSEKVKKIVEIKNQFFIDIPHPILNLIQDSILHSPFSIRIFPPLTLSGENSSKKYFHPFW